MFVCQKSAVMPKKQEKDYESDKPVGGYDSVTKKEKIALMTAFGTIAGCCTLFLLVFSFAIEEEETLNSITKKTDEISQK